MSGGDLLRLLAYDTGIERPVKRYTNQPNGSRACEKPSWVHNSAPSSSAGEAFPVLICLIAFAQEPAPVASGGVALPNGWKLLFGEAIRAKCAPTRGGSQLGLYPLV